MTVCRAALFVSDPGVPVPMCVHGSTVPPIQTTAEQLSEKLVLFLHPHDCPAMSELYPSCYQLVGLYPSCW